MAFYRQPYPKYSRAPAASQTRAKFSWFQFVNWIKILLISTAGECLQSSWCPGCSPRRASCFKGDTGPCAETRESLWLQGQRDKHHGKYWQLRWNGVLESQQYSASTWKSPEYFGISWSFGEQRSTMGLVSAYSNASQKRDPKLLKGFYEISWRQHLPIQQSCVWLERLLRCFENCSASLIPSHPGRNFLLYNFWDCVW